MKYRWLIEVALRLVRWIIYTAAERERQKAAAQFDQENSRA